MSRDLPSQTITAPQAAALLERSTRWVHLRVREGWIVTEGRGRYPLVSVIRGMVAYYEDQIRKSNKAAVSSSTDARTREIGLRIAEREAKLLPVEDCEEVIADLATFVLDELPGFGDRVTDDPDERRMIDGHVDQLADRLRSRRDSALDHLRSGNTDSG